ncbi:MAG: hypothetical protein AB7V43_00100 [Acidimicrobiia bacterium]
MSVVRGLWLPTGWADLESTPSGDGYWVLAASGAVQGFGDATSLGGTGTLLGGEVAVSMSATTTGNGYWVFTDRGRVIARGDAVSYGDASALALVGPIRDSIATASGRGYFMVASDGGVFTFGDARFSGSMGATPLNAPVESLVPDPDGSGYWLVASDGGVFAFDAVFHGSMASVALNSPVEGMVPFGDGYVLVGSDGGAFVFSDRPFFGSLGSSPPASPVVAITARPQGDGYRMLTQSGQVFGFGGASDLGSPAVPGPECRRTLILFRPALTRLDTETGVVASGVSNGPERCGRTHGFEPAVKVVDPSGAPAARTHDGSFFWYRTTIGSTNEIHVVDPVDRRDRIVGHVSSEDRIGGIDLATGRMLVHSRGAVQEIDLATGAVGRRVALPVAGLLVTFTDWSADSRFVGLTYTDQAKGAGFSGAVVVVDLLEASLTMASNPSWRQALYPPDVFVLANGNVAVVMFGSPIVDIGTLTGQPIRTLDLAGGASS